MVLFLLLFFMYLLVIQTCWVWISFSCELLLFSIVIWIYLEKAAGIDFRKGNKLCHDTPPQKSLYFAGARSQCIPPRRTGTGVCSGFDRYFVFLRYSWEGGERDKVANVFLNFPHNWGYFFVEVHIIMGRMDCKVPIKQNYKIQN